MIKWQGADKLHAQLAKARKDAARLVASALFQEGEAIMGASKRVVPVDTGRLRSSGHVKPPAVNGTRVTVELAYGTDYAVYVHEGTRRMAGRKYLEQPLFAAAHNLEQRMATRLGNLL